MILIADSGTTKTDWRVLAPGGSIAQAQTVGINPYQQDTPAIAQVIAQELLPQLAEPGSIEAVYFYGSGCGNAAQCALVAQALSPSFPQAKVVVENDMLAAARALCNTQPGIACIVGTGINTALWNGQEITEQVASLGYVLGDEGSGAWLGRELLAAYLRKELPDDLAQHLARREGTSLAQVLQRVYKEPRPNAYMAGFSKFIFQHIAHPFMHRLVTRGFTAFFEHNVLQYAQHKSLPVHCSGSVAYYYSGILRQVAQDLGLTLRHVLESPIAGLTLYHQQSIEHNN